MTWTLTPPRGTGVLAAAVEHHPIASAVMPGKQAIKSAHRALIEEVHSRVSDSLDYDAATEPEATNERRWDYILGVRSRDNTERVVGAEVHPVSAHGVTDLIAKKFTTRAFFHGLGVKIVVWHWLATSPRVGIRRGGLEHRRLQKAGIEFPAHRIRL